MNGMQINENFEEVYGDVTFYYNLFRGKNMEPGAASGRTMSELGEDIKESPELLFAAYVTLSNLICKEESDSEELLKHQLTIIKAIVKNNEKSISTSLNDLNKTNQQVLSNLFNTIKEKENKYGLNEIQDVQKKLNFKDI